MALALTLAHCGKFSSKVDPKYGVAASNRVVGPGEPVPKGGGTYRVGKPYQVAGRTYTPEENDGYTAEGTASWYGDDFHGRLTANGEVFDMNSVSAAHPTLPIPSYVRVTNLRNNRSVIVRVNDRGPYHGNRVIDVSVRAAKLLGFHQYGVARVRVDYAGRAALEGSDDNKLEATLRHGTPAPGPSPVMVASSRPFLPEFFDPTPAGSRQATAAPPDRALELGHQAAPPRVAKRSPSFEPTLARAPVAPELASSASRPAALSAPSQTAAVEVPASFETRFGPAAHAPAAASRGDPASAFAPRYDGALTGRGIY